MSGLFQTPGERWKAVTERDRSADGAFVFAVRTTGVYCRPGCSSRAPRRENVSFFARWEEAEGAGFRACKRCAPNSAEPNAALALVQRACRRIESAEHPLRLSELAGEAGLSPFHFQRLFKRQVGVTPRAYGDAARRRRFQDGLLSGDGSVTDAIYAAGFGSGTRAYDTAPATLGMLPSAYRAGGRGERITFGMVHTPLGYLAVAKTLRGVCALELGDDAERVRAAIAARFPRAELSEDEHALRAELAAAGAYVERPAEGLSLPLDVRGTAFQQRVWSALTQVPAGSTIAYSELARQVGNPRATRAVASACAANPVALAIPCHRAVRSDGAPGEYRWGAERKRTLLRGERK